MKMTYDEWKEKYNPIVDDNDDTVVYETFGPDLEIIQLIPDNYVWTLIADNDDREFLLAGKHLVNRILYVVTNKCWERRDLSAEW